MSTRSPRSIPSMNHDAQLDRIEETDSPGYVRPELVGADTVYTSQRFDLRPDVSVDIELRRRDVVSEKDWSQYRPLQRQGEVGIYSTGVPRTKFKKMPDKSMKMDQVKANYGLVQKRKKEPMPVGIALVPEPEYQHGTKLPSLEGLSPNQQAAEARPFLPPPDKPKDSLSDEHMQSNYRRLKYDLSTLRKKAEAEIQSSQQESSHLRKSNAAQKEVLLKQSEQIKELTYQLSELRRMQQREVQQEAKKVSSSEKRAAALHRKIGDISQEHELAMAAASAAMTELQNERDALAMALAAVATQALGGEEAAPQSVSQEIDASVKEGNDPLPRTPQSWLGMKYTDISTHSKTTRSKKLAGDGVRAVAALVAQVRRLWHKRIELTTAEAEALNEVDKLSQIIQRVDLEYQVWILQFLHMI